MLPWRENSPLPLHSHVPCTRGHARAKFLFNERRPYPFKIMTDSILTRPQYSWQTSNDARSSKLWRISQERRPSGTGSEASRSKGRRMKCGLIPSILVLSPQEKSRRPRAPALKVVADERTVCLFQASPSALTNTSLPVCEQCGPMSTLGGRATIFFLEVPRSIDVGKWDCEPSLLFYFYFSTT